MIQQLELIQAQVESAAPRCRMCVRPARRNRATQQWGMYCNVNNCTNRDRLCQACGQSFAMGIDGAGTKYCSRDCRDRTPHKGVALCAWCEKPSETAGRVRRVLWPYICAECLDPIKHVVPRLKEHKVTPDRARRLLIDPGCEICGTDIVARVRRTNGKVHARLVVDHDHRCCPVETHSCGSCVRGLICQACNAAAGQLYDDPERARSLAAYLDRFQEAQ